MNHLIIYNFRKHRFDLKKMLLDGVKNAELKMSLKRVAPYNALRDGDWIYIKASGGGVFARAQVHDVQQYELENEPEDFLLNFMLETWSEVGYQNTEHVFRTFENKRYVKYMVFFRYKNLEVINNPINIVKRDQRSFVKDFQLSMDLKMAFGIE